MNSADRVLRSSEEAIEHISGICFKTGPPQRIGVELEWTTHHAGDPAAYLSAGDLAAALGEHAPATLGNPHPVPLPRGSAVTCEPGGQIEISSAVADDLAGLHAAVSADQATLTDLLGRSGIVLGERGIDPHRPPRRILDTPRYAAMERASGRAGRTMMGSTAGLQVCFDAGTPQRWAALNEAGPALIALFANSRRHAGRDTRWSSARMAAWLAMEPRRTGPVPLGGDAALAWARYALDAPLLCVRRDDGPWDAPPGLTLADWITTGAPTVDDVEYHLGTLFPPVRPRGYLEVRYLDAQPGDEWIAPVAVLSALLADDTLAGRARLAAAPGAGRRPAPWPSWPAGTSTARDCRRPCATPSPTSSPAACTQSPPRPDLFRGETRMTQDLRLTIAAELERARARTAALTDAVDETDLIRQHSPLMSPLVWDLAHVGNQEELWLVRDVGGRDPVRQDIDELYDAFKHARKDRPALPLLDPGQARAYVAQVRDKALDVLDHARFDPERPLLDNGFAFGMIVQHEQQHDETMLATHQLRAGEPVLTAPAPPPSRTPVSGEVFVAGGPFTMGTSTDAWALDNERPAHVVDVPGFFIDAAPITNGQYQEFIAAGGYDDPRWWSDRGWAYRVKAGLAAPLHWLHDGTQWHSRQFGRVSPINPGEPVVHVCYFEAEAYAAWAGKRLPTEAEWEKAARFDPATGRSRRFPWGDESPEPRHANLGQRHLSPAPVGAYPDGASPLGVHQMIGDVWEWLSSDFDPYPGFAAFPYREYSEVFFGGDYKMLRGGSFGTDAAAGRSTFRNWDHPIRRQIFSGFRLARDA